MSQIHLDYRQQLYQQAIREKKYGKLLGLVGVELNITELCNRKCVFCPRHDSNVYPNRALNMGIDVIQRIAEQLSINNYKGPIYFSGFGEPFLNKEIIHYINHIRKTLPHCYLEISTNGDFLTKEIILKIKDKVNNIIVDCYDSEQQRNYRVEMYKELEFTNFRVRDLWIPPNTKIDQEFFEDQNFSNRSGAVQNVSFTIPKTHQCFMPFYRITIDWNGRIILCCNDWFRQQDDLGSIMETPLFDIWFSDTYKNIRKNLYNGKRIDSACKNCSANGTFIGKESADLFTF